MARERPTAALLSVEDAPAPKPVDKSFSEMEPEEQRATFVRKVMEERAEQDRKNEPAPPPPMTPRQREKIEAEMAHGREVLAKHAANMEAQRAIPVVRSEAEIKAEGQTTSIFRPEDYVPDMKHGQKASATSRTSNL